MYMRTRASVFSPTTDLQRSHWYSSCHGMVAVQSESTVESQGGRLSVEADIDSRDEGDETVTVSLH